MHQIRFQLNFTAIVFAICLSACNSPGDGAGGLITVNEFAVHTNAPVSEPLPSPLLLPDAFDHESSVFTEEDLIKHADEFSTSLPNNRVIVIGNEIATLAPEWSGASDGL